MKKGKIAELIFFILLFVFAWLLMWKTFRINESGNLEIATKVWSDFAATIPLIRSFSLGQNFPPQYPLFAGPPIRYHFMFFLVVGLLEKIGVRIDWALNLPSSFSFFFLLITIYFLAKEVFKNKSVAALSCILFLFNGSLSFLDFFKSHPLSIHTLSDIVTNKSFPAFAPYIGNSIITAFWSLNIYTNQRHLAFAYASFLILTIIIYKASKKPETLSLNKTLILGIFLGFFPFIHLTVFVMMEISLLILFFVLPNIRKKLFVIALISAIIALPQIIYMGGSGVGTGSFHAGYLISNPSFISFIKYWFFNLGLVTILAPFGFLLAKKAQKKVFLPFLSFFVIGNLFQFSPEIAANHKFFNLFIIGANIFAAYSIYNLWRHTLLGKTIAVLCFILITLSGLIDIFPIKNDVYAEIKDYKNNDTEQFIIDHAPKESVFINASYVYDPASLAGRKIFLGWPYFPWSAGYNTQKRVELMKKILESSDINGVCALLRQEDINYIEIQNPTTLEGIKINYKFFKENFREISSSPTTNIDIYDVALSCE